MVNVKNCLIQFFFNDIYINTKLIVTIVHRLHHLPKINELAHDKILYIFYFYFWTTAMKITHEEQLTPKRNVNIIFRNINYNWFKLWLKNV